MASGSGDGRPRIEDGRGGDGGLEIRGGDLVSLVLCFDKHDVIDVLSHSECSILEVSLDHAPGVAHGIISFGRYWWRDTFQGKEFAPLVVSSCFEAFTDQWPTRVGVGSLVARHPGPAGRANTRLFSGTKGEAARVLLLPAFAGAHFVLIDDKEENIEEFIAALPAGRASGVLVRLGRKSNKRCRWNDRNIGLRTTVVYSAVELLDACLRFVGHRDEWAARELAAAR